MLTRIFAAAVFALLTMIAPAHAATIPNAIEAVDITFANGWTLTGEMEWHYGALATMDTIIPSPAPQVCF